MKELNLYQIRDMAMGSGRAVFSIQQLANLTGKPKAVARVYASRLVKRGLATRVLRGRLSFTDDDFVVATQLVEPSYVSLQSALLFHGLTTQVPACVECISPKNSRRYLALGIAYHKMPPSLMFGYEAHARSGSYAFVADPEKALLDMAYLFPRAPLPADLLGKVDRARLGRYMQRFQGRGEKRLGMLLVPSGGANADFDTDAVTDAIFILKKQAGGSRHDR